MGTRPTRCLGRIGWLAAFATGLAATSALAARPVTLKVPRFVVPPHTDREVCTIVRVPRQAFDSAGTVIVNQGGGPGFVTHHFLLFVYAGNDIDAFPPDGKVVDTKACLDFGPSDRSQRILIAGIQTKRERLILPRGVAQKMEPAKKGQPIGFILNSHWINSSDRPQTARVKVKLYPAKKRSVRRYLQPIFEVFANATLMVPPGEAKTVGSAWRPRRNAGPDLGAAFGGTAAPSVPACVTSVSAHMHKRGSLFTVNLVKDGVRSLLFTADDYSDPGQLTLDGRKGNPPPILMNYGDRLEYECLHNNGTTDETGKTAPVKLGCEEEETAGEPPGMSIIDAFAQQNGRLLQGAAKACTTDADCPPTDPAYRGITFTGRCVEANLVFGFSSDDEMCILPGSYYPANMDAPPGHECDLKLMPRLASGKSKGR